MWKLLLLVIALFNLVSCSDLEGTELDITDAEETKFLYESALARDLCDWKLSQIDYKCDMSYDKTDINADIQIARASSRCARKFLRWLDNCRDKVSRRCRQSYVKLVSHCDKGVQNMEEEHLRATERIDKICDAKYKNYDVECSKKNMKDVDVSSLTGHPRGDPFNRRARKQKRSNRKLNKSKKPAY